MWHATSYDYNTLYMSFFQPQNPKKILSQVYPIYIKSEITVINPTKIKNGITTKTKPIYATPMTATGKNSMASTIFKIPQDAFSANPKSFQVVVHNRIMNNSVSMISPSFRIEYSATARGCAAYSLPHYIIIPIQSLSCNR